MDKKNGKSTIRWTDLEKIYESYVHENINLSNTTTTLQFQFPSDLEEVSVKIEKNNLKSTRVINQLEDNKLHEKIRKKKRPKTIFDRHNDDDDDDNNNNNNNYDQNQSNINTIILPLERVSEQEQDASFLRKLEKLNTTNLRRENIIPPQANILRYVKTLHKQEQPLWVDNVNARLIAANRKYPVLQVLCHKYISQFLREPKKDERPCNQINCQSFEMGKFRCRELIMPNDKKQPQIPGMCYLCHLFETTRMYLYSLNNDISKYTTNKIYAIHKFIVKTDIVGEYRLDKTIQGNTNVVGIFGPVPFFNRNNYTHVRTDGCNAWQENSALLFRLSQKVSNQIKSSLTIHQVKGRL